MRQKKRGITRKKKGTVKKVSTPPLRSLGKGILGVIFYRNENEYFFPVGSGAEGKLQQVEKGVWLTGKEEEGYPSPEKKPGYATVIVFATRPR